MSDYIPLTPERDQFTELVTYQDAVERALIHWDRPAGERDSYLVRKAISDALRELCRHHWKWYTATFLLTTEASYETGTIAYNHATRTVTLTDGTWPANAAFGTLQIDDVAYLVNSRVSDSQITLRTDGNPGANLAAGTEYCWFRESYTLPPGFISMEEPKDTNFNSGGPDMLRIRKGAMLGVRRLYSATPVTCPAYCTIERDPRREGKVLAVAPPPASARTYEFVYRRAARVPRVDKYATGKVTVTNGSTAVTGTGTTWSARHVGTVLRVSEVTTVEPTGPYGNRRQAGDLEVQYNPSALTRIVTAVTDATHLTIDSAADVDLSATKYTLSDPIDVDWLMCGEYFDRLVEYFVAVNAHETAKGERQADPIKQRWAAQMDAFHRAADRDRMNDAVPSSAPWWTDWTAFLGPSNVSTEYT
jgi:hypothetical protein